MSSSMETAPLNTSEIQLHVQERGKPPPYRWEAAMNHHCGVCFQKIKFSCIGEHGVLCRKYHAMLFIKGQEKNCRSCHEGEQELAKKAREIAELKQQLLASAEPSSPASFEKRAQQVFHTPGKTKREKRAEKKIQKDLERKRASTMNKTPHVIGTALRYYAGEDVAFDADQNLAQENAVLLFKKTDLWVDGSQPTKEDADICGGVLSAFDIHCSNAAKNPDKVKFLRKLNSNILTAVAWIKMEAQGVKDREESFRNIVSNRRAEAMKKYFQEQIDGEKAVEEIEERPGLIERAPERDDEAG